jgi:hypothetical protein
MSLDTQRHDVMKEDDGTATSRHGLRIRAAALSICLATCLAVVWHTSGADSHTSVQFGSTDPSGPVSIRAVYAPSLWAEDSEPDVRVAVANRGATTVQAEIWWLLANVNDLHPWAHPSVSSPHERITLAPGQDQIVSVAGDGRAAVAGTFSLSVWVHTGRPGAASATLTHSDGGAANTPITVQRASPTIQRRFAPSSSIQVTGCTAITRSASVTKLIAQVTNFGVQTADIETWSYVAPSTDDNPWLNAQTTRSATQTTTLDPGASATLALVSPTPTRSGSTPVAPSIWVHQLDPNSVSLHLDGAWCNSG